MAKAVDFLLASRCFLRRRVQSRLLTIPNLCLAISKYSSQGFWVERFLDRIIGTNLLSKFLCRKDGGEQDYGDMANVGVIMDGAELRAQVKTWHPYVVKNDVRALCSHYLEHSVSVSACHYIVTECLQ